MSYYPPPPMYGYPPPPPPMYAQPSGGGYASDESIIGWIIEVVLFLGMIALVIYYLSHPDSPLRDIINPETVRKTAERVGAPVPERESKMTTENIVWVTLGSVIGFIVLFLFVKRFHAFVKDKLPSEYFDRLEDGINALLRIILYIPLKILGDPHHKKDDDEGTVSRRGSTYSEFDGVGNLFQGENEVKADYLEKIAAKVDKGKNYYNKKTNTIAKLENELHELIGREELTDADATEILNEWNNFFKKDGDLKDKFKLKRD